MSGRRAKGRRVGRSSAGLLLALVAGLAVVTLLAGQPATPQNPATTSPVLSVPAADDPVVLQAPRSPGESPGASSGESPGSPGAQRLVPLPTPPAGDGGYSLVALEPGSTVARFDPCLPIEVRVNPDGAPPGWRDLVEQALEPASRASGLLLRLVGTTTEPASPSRDALQPGRYGNAWAPVLIAWTDEQTIPGLAGDALGLGGPTSYGTQDSSTLVTGFVYLDGPGLASTSVDLTAAVLAHEVGHLLGLDHIDDPDQLMYPVVRSDVVQYRDGDLRGLADAGSGPCANPG